MGDCGYTYRKGICMLTSNTTFDNDDTLGSLWVVGFKHVQQLGEEVSLHFSLETKSSNVSITHNTQTLYSNIEPNGE